MCALYDVARLQRAGKAGYRSFRPNPVLLHCRTSAEMFRRRHRFRSVPREMTSILRVQIQGVSKRFAAARSSASPTAGTSGSDHVAVNDVSLDVASGEFFSLLGPSGCGKTTLLRILAGFETPDDGGVWIDGKDVTHLPPNRRPTNLVFQHYALFPHLSVARNVAFGLGYKGIKGADAQRLVEVALEQVQLTGFASRMPHQLSGGQKQRVALARALVLQPSVLLLDEPLSALDQKLRREMQVELKHLQRSLGITFIFVTHDQEEALVMSDRIAVMNAGRLEQVGPSAEVFEQPRTEFVARFMGAANFFAEGSRRFVVRPEKLSLQPIGALEREGFTTRQVQVVERRYQGLSCVWMVKDERGETLSVYQQNNGGEAAQLPTAEGSPALLAWDRRHEVTIAN